MNRYECVLMALGLFSLHIDAQNIQNVDSIPELNEVLVTGYRTISRERAAGSYDIVNSKEIEKRHTLSTSSILDGIVAGMQGSRMDEEEQNLQFEVQEQCMQTNYH